MTRVQFRHGADCEEALCKSCVRKGYGDDAWLPLTTEYWATENGKFVLSACKACRSEVRVRAVGMVAA